jgi:AAHS family 4-hydroxybenzoate transporter-like MFS transporter
MTLDPLPGAHPATLEKEVGERIDAGSIGPAQAHAFTLCLVLGILAGYNLAIMGLAVPLIARDWNVAPGSFGTTLAAVMIGIAVGNIMLGWLGDRTGRKPVVILSAFAMGVASLGILFAGNVTALTVWRFLLGITFGASLPNTFALVADIVPSRNRAFCMTLVSAPTSIGGIISGLVAPVLSEGFGWKGIFLVGGLTPLVLGMLMMKFLCESPKVLAVRNRVKELRETLAAFGLNSTLLPEARADSVVLIKSQLLDLVRDGMLIVTVCYLFGWICCGFTYYLMANWMPTLLINSGWSNADAQRSVTLLYAGSMAGGLVLSWLMDRSSRSVFIPAIGCVIGVGLFLASGFGFSSPALLYVLLAGLGIAVGGSQYVMSAMAGRLYPSRLLATALSWCGSLSRVGSVFGPMVGGWMLLAGWSPPDIMMVMCLGPLLAAAAFAIMAVAIARRSTYAA